MGRYMSTTLNDKQMKAIELLVNGETKANVAKLIDVNIKTIYAWMKVGIFKDELNRQVNEMKKQVETRLAMQVEPLMNEITRLALTSKDESIRLKASTYALDRIWGKATTKQDINVTTTDKTAQIEDIDSILNNLDIDVVDTEYKEDK